MTQRVRRIVIIAFYFPPDPAVGALRPWRLARALTAAGHRVDVVAAAQHGADPTRIETEGIVVHRIRFAAGPRAWIQRRRARMREAQPAPAASPGQDTWEPAAAGHESLEQRLRRWVLSIVWLPDDRQGFIFAAARAVRALHREGPGVDLIYSSGPPHSVHLAATRASRALEVPCALEFRDPWTDQAKPAIVRSPLVEAIERWLERRALIRARYVVSVTRGIAEGMERKRDAIGATFTSLTAYNGIPDIEEADGLRTGPTVILHAGELYLRRDPRPFLAAVAEGVRSGRLDPVNLRIEFLGSGGGTYQGVAIGAMAGEYGLGNVVHCHGHIEYAAAMARLARADLLLLLAQRQPAQVPNKLFDYLAVRRPILAYLDSEGDSARLLRQVGGHTLITPETGDPNEIVVPAILAARKTEADRWKNSPEHEQLSTRCQLGALARALETG